MKYKIALLKGGLNNEREISLKTAEECSLALKKLGHKVYEFDIKDQFINKLSELKIDVCFNALHGSLGENGSIQGLLNYLKIPYTHSGVKASSVAMDKSLTKTTLSKFGIVFPEVVDIEINQYIKPVNYDGSYVIKPKSEGSSVGIKIVKKDTNCLIPSSYWKNAKELISEVFIEGIELTVGILAGKALCVTEIIAEKNSFYDYESKYSHGGSKHIIPAKLPQIIEQQAIDWAEKAYIKLECRGIARADFRYNPKTLKLFMLEINTQPGMTKTSLIPEQAIYSGISFKELIKKLLELAQCD